MTMGGSVVMEERTTVFRSNGRAQSSLIAEVLGEVYQALRAKGYNPVGQIVGYLMSGDPTYITSHKDARNLIRQLERDEILEELVASYLQKTQEAGQ